MPLTIPPPCRTPARRSRCSCRRPRVPPDANPTTSSGWNPSRSADPPISSGSTGASASIAFCEALRVAIVSALRVHVFEQLAAQCCRQRAGSSPAMRRRNSAAFSGCAACVAAQAFVPLRLDAAPRARARSSRRRRAAGFRTADAVQPRLSRVAATSSAPSGAPCAAPVFAFFGAPFAITVLQQMSVGRCRFALRAARSPRPRAADVMAVHARDHVPAVGFETARRVVGEPAA